MTELSRDVIHYLITSYFCSREDRRVHHKVHNSEWYTYRNKRDGPYQYWYRNGKLMISCNYVDGELDGLCQSWYLSNGVLIDSCNYVNGKRHGLYQRWGSNGILYESCNYVNGKKTE